MSLLVKENDWRLFDVLFYWLVYATTFLISAKMIYFHLEVKKDKITKRSVRERETETVSSYCNSVKRATFCMSHERSIRLIRLGG